MKRIFIQLFVALSFVLFLLPHSFLLAKDMIGAGSSFSYPLYKKMFYVYLQKRKKRVNYQILGSGGGERQLKKKLVSFCASENLIVDASGKKDPLFIQIPSCVSPVVISYNLPNNLKIRLTQHILVHIYLGKIKKWNHPELLRCNPGVKMPSVNIIVVHRSDSSGTSLLFTNFLSQKSVQWKKKVGSGLSVAWPIGVGANKNMGVSALIKQIPGSIGYLVYSYAISSSLSMALLENDSGDFLHPSQCFESENRGNPSPVMSYPIIGKTWLIMYKEQGGLKYGLQQSRDLCELFWWMTHEGQFFAKELFYMPLSSKLSQEAESLLLSVTYDNKKVLSNTSDIVKR